MSAEHATGNADNERKVTHPSREHNICGKDCSSIFLAVGTVTARYTSRHCSQYGITLQYALHCATGMPHSSHYGASTYTIGSALTSKLTPPHRHEPWKVGDIANNFGIEGE